MGAQAPNKLFDIREQFEKQYHDQDTRDIHDR